MTFPFYMIAGSPYRSQKSYVLNFVDYVNYYEDARAIGWSHNRAMDYAFKCCLEDLKTLEMHALAALTS